MKKLKINGRAKFAIEHPPESLLEDIKNIGNPEEILVFLGILLAADNKGTLKTTNDQILSFINNNFSYLKENTIKLIRTINTN